jgi:hypothetical protein
MRRGARAQRVTYRVYDEEDFPYGADPADLLDGEQDRPGWPGRGTPRGSAEAVLAELGELPALPGSMELPERSDRAPRVPPVPRARHRRGVLRAVLAAAAGSVLGLAAAAGIRSMSGLEPGGRHPLPAAARVDRRPRSMLAGVRTQHSRPVRRRARPDVHGRRALPRLVAASTASAQGIGTPAAAGPQRYPAIEFGFER